MNHFTGTRARLKIISNYKAINLTIRVHVTVIAATAADYILISIRSVNFLRGKCVC